MLLLATLLGLGIAIAAIAAIGPADVLRAVARIGWRGFAAFWLYSLCVFVLLGAAWLAVARDEPATRLPLFVWARLVREGASDLLPFSQLGGLVLGARVLLARGIPGTRVYAAMIADQTTEIGSQLLVTVVGVAMLAPLIVGRSANPALLPALGVAVTVLAVLIAIVATSRRWIGPVARRIAGRFAGTVVVAVDDVAREVGAIYAAPARVAASFLFNIAGWIASAAGAWLVLRLIGEPFALGRTLALESVIFALRSAAFAIPGGLGVQEAGYALIAPLIGLPPEAALALAVVKRARDLAIALPVLILWQADEARQLLATAPSPQESRR